jgi:hypothetical protein
MTSDESSGEEFLRSLCRAKKSSDCGGVGEADGVDSDSDDDFLRALCKADRRHPFTQALDASESSGLSASAASGQDDCHLLPLAGAPSLDKCRRPATMMTTPSASSPRRKVTKVDPHAAETPSDVDDDDDSSCQSPRAFDDLIEDEKRSVVLQPAISFEEQLSQDRESCAAQLRHAVSGASLFYVGTTINVLRRWTGGQMPRGYMEGHVNKWQQMRVIGMAANANAKKLEEFLIEVGKSEFGSRCANISRRAIGQCRSRPNFLYVCLKFDA